MIMTPQQTENARASYDVIPSAVVVLALYIGRPAESGRIRRCKPDWSRSVMLARALWQKKSAQG